MADPKADSAPALDAATLALLGRSLSGFYVAVIEQPVPDTLLSILRKTQALSLINRPRDWAAAGHSEAPARLGAI